MTQGAVAQHVRALEARLDLRLFERRHKSLAFTEAGRGYHDQVVQAFAILSDATAQLAPQPQKVTISVTPTFASKWLIPNLGDFTAGHPDIDLRILATESLSSFHGDGVDLVVRQGKPPFGASLEAIKLFDEEVVAVCAPALMLDTDGLPGGGMTAGAVLLHDSHNLWARFLADVMQTGHGVVEKDLRFSQTAHSVEAALAGQGIALASRFLVARDLAAGRLVQPVPGCLKGDRGFYVLVPRSSRRSKAIDAVWHWLISQSQTGEQWSVSPTGGC